MAKKQSVGCGHENCGEHWVETGETICLEVGRTTEDQMNESARELGGVIGDMLPDDVGFALMLVSKGDAGWLSWISNLNRDNMIEAMEEFIKKTRDRAMENSSYMG